MARFLLGTQTFVDLACLVAGKPRVWLAKVYQTRGVMDLDLAISALSLVQIEQAFKKKEAQGPLDAEMIARRHRCRAYAQEFRNRNSILAFGDSEVAAWSLIASLPLLYIDSKGVSSQIGDGEIFVVATALATRLTLLDHLQPAHTALGILGLLVEDPYV